MFDGYATGGFLLGPSKPAVEMNIIFTKFLRKANITIRFSGRNLEAVWLKAPTYTPNEGAEENRTR
jgi:hypothetical protein